MGITRYFDPKLSEELRLRSGILRKEALSRTLEFRRQYFDWQQNAANDTLKKLQHSYEATFFQDETDCKVFRRQQNGRVCFTELKFQKNIELDFVLDEFKSRCLPLGYHCFRAESWKLLRAEEGVETHQRYLLHFRKSGWFYALFSRWLDSELLVLESISNPKTQQQLEIRLYPAKNGKVALQGIDGLMTELLRQYQS